MRCTQREGGIACMSLSCRFISELMDVFLMAGVHQQPEQSNYLAEGQT